MDSLPPSARLVGIGFYVGICIAGGTLAGVYVDRALDTGKLMTLLGLALGLFLAIYGGLRQLFDVLAAINARRMGRDKQ